MIQDDHARGLLPLPPMPEPHFHACRFPHCCPRVDHVRARLLSALLCHEGEPTPPGGGEPPPPAANNNPAAAPRSSHGLSGAREDPHSREGRETATAALSRSPGKGEAQRPFAYSADAGARVTSLPLRAAAAASVAAFNASLARCTRCELPKVWTGSFGAYGDALLDVESMTSAPPGGTSSSEPPPRGNSSWQLTAYCRDASREKWEAMHQPPPPPASRE